MGSASIGAALVLLSPNEIPKIKYSVRHAIKMRRKLDIDRFVLSMKDSLSRVMHDLETKGVKHLKFTKRGIMTPNIVFCILSAPWYASHVRTISVKQEKEFRISRHLLSDVLEKEIMTFKKTQSEKYIQEGLRRGEIDLIEKEIIRVKLNGYTIENPYNRETKNFEMLLFLSVAPTQILNKIKKIVAHVFHSKDIIFHSFGLASFSVLSDVWQNTSDYLFLDISGEITEILLVKDGTLHETATFPMGKNYVIRKVAHSLKVSPIEATSLLNVYNSGKASKTAQDRIRHALDKTKDEWRNLFKDTVSKLGEGEYIPPVIFLTADDTLASWFVSVLKSEDNDTELTAADSESDTVVNLIDHKVLEHYVHASTEARKDPFLLINTLFANKIYYL